MPCEPFDLHGDRGGGRMGCRGHDPAAGDEFDLQVVACLFAAAEVAEPGAKGVDVGRHRVMPEADAIGDERRLPAVVAHALHRHHGPLAGLAVSHMQPAVEFFVAVADDVGLDHYLVAPDPLDGEAATIDLGPHAINRHPTSELVGEFHESFRRSCSRCCSVLQKCRNDGVKTRQQRLP